MSNMRQLIVLGLAIAACAGTAAHAATYGNSNDDGQIYYFGYPDTTSYGQVFTAPGGALTSWTFYDGDPTSTGANFVVAAWNGSQAVGPALLTELAQTVSSTASGYAHTYSANLNLTSGVSYIAYLTVAGVASPTGLVSVAGSLESPLGGGFEFLNSDGVDPLTLNDAWSSYYIPDMQYSATFGTAVPEPASWTLALLGIGGLGASLRLRRRASTAALA